jgi:hypothetical protein
MLWQGRSLACEAWVPFDRSGYCECAGGVRVARSGCGHAPLRCVLECANATDATGAADLSGEAGGGADGGAGGGAGGAVVVGLFGTSGTLVDSIGLICSDGTRVSAAPTTSGGTPFRLLCPGWGSVDCVDEADEHCASWAAAGECATNAPYMATQCAASCGTCTPPPPADELPHLSTGLLKLNVRAGDHVDAIQLRCGEPPPAGGTHSGGGQPEGADGADADAQLATVPPAPPPPPWAGGGGGDECALTCEGEPPLRGVLVRAGHMVDSVEVGC